MCCRLCFGLAPLAWAVVPVGFERDFALESPYCGEAGARSHGWILPPKADVLDRVGTIRVGSMTSWPCRPPPRRSRQAPVRSSRPISNPRGEPIDAPAPRRSADPDGIAGAIQGLRRRPEARARVGGGGRRPGGRRPPPDCEGGLGGCREAGDVADPGRDHRRVQRRQVDAPERLGGLRRSPAGGE